MRHGWCEENGKLRTNIGIFKINEGILFYLKTEHFTMCCCAMMKPAQLNVIT
jgi:hypothetical protein